MSIVALGVTMISYILILLRWPHGSTHWEFTYSFGAGAGIGGLLSTQFVGLSASTPEEMSATAITIYYLSQQIGEILGITLAATVSRGLFKGRLLRNLGTQPEDIKVSDPRAIQGQLLGNEDLLTENTMPDYW